MQRVTGEAELIPNNGNLRMAASLIRYKDAAIGIV